MLLTLAEAGGSVHKFRAHLIYIVSSRRARDIQANLLFGTLNPLGSTAIHTQHSSSISILLKPTQSSLGKAAE